MTAITGCENGGNLDFATQLDSTILFTKYPELTLFTQKAPLPPIRAIYPDIQGPRLRIPAPAQSIAWETVDVTFLVLKNLSNYEAIHNWIVDSINKPREEIVSDATQIFMLSDKTPVKRARYLNMYPIALSGLNQQVDTGNIQYLQATVTFRYYYYEFER